ncbi:FecR domain-containing protein [Henriciella sp. AS95]|uniref:FecR family protein n=1 Tax=Henriciella sp. AS95 TaxID=3135782 RepID=UPI0031799595
MAKRKPSEDTDDQAAEWAARLDRGSLSERESHTLQAWLDADSRHQGALVRAQAMLAPCEPRDTVIPIGQTERGSRRVWAAGAALASVAAAFLVGVLVLSPPPTEDLAYQTAYGEVRRVPLNDGSVMTLNTRSKADIEFGETNRSVKLIEGEGFFEVAPDKSRPFLVNSDGYTVKAVGTAFVVRKQSDDRIQVVVYEGIVDVASQTTSPLRLKAGDMVEIGHREPSPQVSTLDDEQLLQELAWREGKIALTGQTLEYAAREFNRYNEVHIRVEPAVSGLEVVGWYSANDPVGFARLVADTMELEVSVSGQEIVLSPLQ